MSAENENLDWLHWPIKQPELLSSRLILRPFTQDDASTVQMLANDKDIFDNVARIPYPYSLEDGVKWISEHPQNYANKKCISFAITLTKTQELIGTISLDFNLNNRRAELGYWLGKKYWNKGFCTEAARTIIEFAFQQLNLNKVTSHHLSRNPASGRVLLKAGLQHEGSQRKHIFKNNVAEDVELYGIVKNNC